MTSREKILKRVETNQPKKGPAAPQVELTPIAYSSPVSKFHEILTIIGGKVILVNDANVKKFIQELFPEAKRIVSSHSALPSSSLSEDPHEFANVDVCVLEGILGVAENGAIWITDRFMLDRALPFICENLVLILRRATVVNNMAEAYEIIGNADYEYGTFIAGPSKTADIEQSLVLGAHGPKSLTVFLVD